MNDDELRSELERRSSAGSPDEHLIAAILPSHIEPATPRRSWRLAPVAGLAAAVAIVVLVVGTLPSLAPPGAPSPSTASPGDSGQTISPVEGRRVDCALGTESNPLVGEPAIEDHTSRVESCQLVDPGRGIPDGVLVTNLDPILGELLVKWSGTPCDAASVFTLRETSEGWELNGQRPSVDCDASLVPHAMRIALSEPIDATTVTASLPIDGLEPSISPNPVARTFECGADPTVPRPTPVGPVPVVIDETGLIIGCLQTDVMAELTGEISVSNPFGPNEIEVVWADGPCDAEIVFTFGMSGDGYELAGRRPDQCWDAVDPGPISIQFSRPMPAENVSASVIDDVVSPPITSPSPTPSPAVIHECGDDIVTFVDRSGVVASCSNATDRGLPSTNASITEESRVVSVAWPVLLDNACQPLPSVVTVWGPVAGSMDWYVVQVTTLALSTGETLPGGGICDAATGMHYLDIAITETVEPGRIWTLAHEVETSPTRLRSGSAVETSAGWFEFELTANSRTFEANEPIRGLGASLHYAGSENLRMSGFVQPHLGFRQLDGELFLSPAPFEGCPSDEQDVAPDEVIEGFFRLPSERTPGDSGNTFYDEYMYDGQFRLPPGTYAVSAYVAGQTESGCGGEAVDLSASIVIRVR